MPLSWNEIKARSIAFAKEWEDESSEDAEAKSFWDAFFNVFGIHRRRIASFEVPIKRHDGSGGFIDLLWKGILLVEHKSRGKDLDGAYSQARDYFPGIKDRDLPRYVLVSDFQKFRLHDLESGDEHAFALKDLPRHIRLFGFMAGYQSRAFKDQDPVNIKAAERMGLLHDALRDDGYTGHKLEVLLVRILFCLFAEDTGIFEPRRRFQDYIEQRTNEDGSDLGGHLATLFDVLDTSTDDRQRGLDAQLAGFPYVNGKLFNERLSPAAFNSTMRERLLDACGLNWSHISPAIFGALFQSIMNAKARRNLGAHYTSEKNILKVIGPLFLDGLRAEFAKAKSSRAKLHEFHEKIASLKFLDPACGCGNFLVIAYRELRLLELEVIEVLYQKDQEAGQVIDPRLLIKCNVHQFYGIEIEEFPAQIAQLALWLVDHQVNQRVSELFGNPFERLPLTASAKIVHRNALHIDWNEVVAAEELDYILGNPPFVGSKLMDDDQRSDLLEVACGLQGAGTLDFVAAWYLKSADYIQGNPSIRCAFVSTNSITQGEQVGVLWNEMLRRGVNIHYAHRTFLWNNEARNVAAVHCVIIGFGLEVVSPRRLFDYASLRAEPHEIEAANISPYLVDASNIVLIDRSKPICSVPEIGIGNKPIDGGYFLLSPEERSALLATEPAAEPLLKRWYGATEFINDEERWCLWVAETSPATLRTMPVVMAIIDQVRRFRLGEIDAKSGRKAKGGQSSRALAATPTKFHVQRVPKSDYLLIPRHSSEQRQFIPMGFMSQDAMSGDANLISEDASLYHFGVLQSTMHMAWTRAVCGRIKSDIRYSAGIVYNNYPWPEDLSDKQREAIELAAQGIIDARAGFPDDSLADNYDRKVMPPSLMRAHQALDRAVDAAYGKRRFAAEVERVSFLLERYEHLVSLLPAPKKRKRASRSQ